MNLTLEEIALVGCWRNDEIERLRSELRNELASEGRVVKLDGVSIYCKGPDMLAAHTIASQLRALLVPRTARDLAADVAIIKARLLAHRAERQAG